MSATAEVLGSEAIDDFSAVTRGRVLRSGDDGYDEARLVHNGMFDKRPLAVVMAEQVGDKQIDLVVGMESRGFIFSAPLAYKLGGGFVPVRKLGKLPAETVEVEYELEYGTATLEIHRDAVNPGERVLIVDDVLATGGTANATASLVERIGGKVCGIACLIELDFLHGRDRLPDHELFSLIHY